MKQTARRSWLGGWWLLAGLALTAIVYWPGLSGGWMFDDYPNIVDNHGVQPSEVSIPALVRATLSSPSSDFKRPLASLSFAANYLASGLDPYAMKLTNLVIHLLNGLLVFVLARLLLRSVAVGAHPVRDDLALIEELSRTGCAPTEQERHTGIIAALIAAGWMLLPINLTAVLYVVQRMESMANLFVLLGLIGYVAGRRRMLAASTPCAAGNGRFSPDTRGLALCLLSITVPTALGLLAKETAVMLPLYALLIEWVLFHFRTSSGQRDWRIIGSFVVVLVLPMLIGLGWLLPGLLKPQAWAARDFTMGTRLLSEARIVIDYIPWTLLPTPHALSFYHDDFAISTGLLAPWSTLASVTLLVALVALMLWLRTRRPLAALGIALFLGCQLLTGTILQLELIYEHRNYFASFGLLLAIMPLLAAPVPIRKGRLAVVHKGLPPIVGAASAANQKSPTSKSVAAEAAPTGALPFGRARHALLACLMLYWTILTAFTAYAWGDPLRLAEDLASRAPQSPRAQYELGRTYIIYSHYDPASPFTTLAYAPLEQAASLPKSSILPQQALIFMNSRMHLPLKDAWWDSMVAKLKAHDPGVQDESSLAALAQCARDGSCPLPTDRMVQAFEAALDHPKPSARLQAIYGDYAWNVLGDHALGLRMTEGAVKDAPSEPAYRISLVRMLVALGSYDQARTVLQQLQPLNIGGRLNESIAGLQALLPHAKER
ncbi:tetratricopeptide repeat protein [Rhodanobacter umsongensis]